MWTHSYSDNYVVCGKKEAYSEPIAAEGQKPTCIECRFHDYAKQRWEEYVAQEVNFGEDDHKTRLAEHDAYVAGVFAGIEKFYPFGEE